MVSIVTYVFLDLETTGLPLEETNRTKITELSMIAVKREHLLTTPAGSAPRVQNKLTLCFNPGLLVLTGVLWGCTNPFIRQGTKGLRSVKSETRLGQAYAEIVFLLSNWRYVLPFLVNQCGSLVYLLAVQRAPLSLAVPTSNSLAFAFTAITGSLVGAEEPLDYGSILGIALIAIGTALCCWDKS